MSRLRLGSLQFILPLVLLFSPIVVAFLVPQQGCSRVLSSSHGPSASASASASESATTSASASASALNYGLYEVQEEMLVNRGILEEELMAGNGKMLEPSKPKGVGSSGGFGGVSSVSSKAQGQAHAQTLKQDGVVRIDGVLPGKLADELRTFVLHLRETSTADVENGTVKQIDRFANVLLKKDRCDLTIPIGPNVVTLSLQHLLCKSPIKDTMEQLLSPAAVLYELSCLISDPGSQRQVVHPDNPFANKYGMPTSEPTLLTCFVALQDIDVSMGPTVWLPGTHTKDAHENFLNDIPQGEGEESPKDKLLRNSPHVLGLLKKGSCAIFDSRLLHCGSANRSTETRALFYFSFKNPKIGYPGNPASIRREIGEMNLSMDQLTNELAKCKSKKLSPALQAIAAKLR